MRRVFMVVLGLALTAGRAHAVDIGIGAYGGWSTPVLNDLSKQGSTYGLRVPVTLAPVLALEGFYATSSLGDAEESFGTPITYTRDGGKTTGFGVNALATFGSTVKFYPMVGIGTYTFERQGVEDISDVGYNLGLGMAYTLMPRLTLDVRGEFNMISNGETAVKAGNLTVGAAYSLFTTP